VLLARFAQVHVHVDQARTEHQTRGNVDDGRAIGGQVAADARDAIAVDQHVV
jgi:hypothetical protein